MNIWAGEIVFQASTWWLQLSRKTSLEISTLTSIYLNYMSTVMSIGCKFCAVVLHVRVTELSY